MDRNLLDKASLPIFIILSLTGSALNVTCIGVFAKRPHIRRKIPNELLVHQACVDLFNTAICCPYYVISLILYFNNYNQVEKLWTFYDILISISTWTSLLSFTLIGIDRFLAIHKPIWHNDKVEIKHIRRSMMLVWILSLLFNVPYALKHFIVHFVTVAASFIIFLINIILYVATAVTAKRQLQLSPAAQLTTTDALQENIRKQREMKLVKKLLIMFVCFFTGFIITGVGQLVQFIQLLQGDSRYLVVIMGEIFFAVISLINPLFTLFKNDFKIGSCIHRNS